MFVKASQLLKFGLKSHSYYALVQLTRSCCETGLFSHGEQIHCHAIKSGFDSNTFVSTALITFYVKFERICNAHKLFDEIPEPSLVSWNCLISGYVHSGKFRKSLKLFLELERNLCADSYSFTASLSACGKLGLVQVGRSLHSKILKYGAECSVVVANCLIDMYGKCGFVPEAIRVFEYMVGKDTISWNAVIAANARNGKLEQAHSFLHQMPEPDTISYNELIDGTARYGVIKDAIYILSKMPNPNSSSWNSIITGYVNKNGGSEAFKFFCKMHLNGVKMDQFTFSIILSGVSSLSALKWGTLIHCYVLKCGLDEYVVVGTALINMYLKCGLIDKAEGLFRSLPDKNIITWNAMISGYAHNGNYTKVIKLFELLRTITDLHPDEITFLNLLSACWHNKRPIKVANQYFEMMIKDYSIDPSPEHCILMIRLLAQEGELNEAVKMINEQGYDSCGAVWKALLSACVACGNIEVAEVAAKKIDESGNDNEFVYVMMSNIYARHGNWKCVGGIREFMKKRNIRKEAGRSWIEVEHVTPQLT